MLRAAVDAANTVIARVRHEHVTLAVADDVRWIGELGGVEWAIHEPRLLWLASESLDSQCAHPAVAKLRWPPEDGVRRSRATARRRR